MGNIAKIKQSKDIFAFDGSMAENMKMAEMLAHSDVVPQEYRNKPGNVIVAVQMGQEVGLKPMQALQGIAVINGRPTIWGDALIGLVRSYPMCEYVKETFDEATMTATCTAKRKDNDTPYAYSFSKDDAIRAGLWQDKATVYSHKYKKEVANTSPWYRYQKRLLQMRARGFCLRDLFPEALKGLGLAEEVQDYEPVKQVNEAPQQTQKTSKINDIINSSSEEIKDDQPSFFERIEACQTLDELLDLSEELSKVPVGDERNELSAAYNAKGKSLTKAAKGE